jgi:hypothetical protein
MNKRQFQIICVYIRIQESLWLCLYYLTVCVYRVFLEPQYFSRTYTNGSSNIETVSSKG